MKLFEEGLHDLHQDWSPMSRNLSRNYFLTWHQLKFEINNYVIFTLWLRHQVFLNTIHLPNGESEGSISYLRYYRAFLVMFYVIMFLLSLSNVLLCIFLEPCYIVVHVWGAKISLTSLIISHIVSHSRLNLNFRFERSHKRLFKKKNFFSSAPLEISK